MFGPTLRAGKSARRLVLVLSGFFHMVAIPSKLTTIRKKEGDGDGDGIWRRRGME